MDDKTRLIYQAALDRYLSAKFLQKIFRGLLTTQYIYPTALRRHTFPLWSIWNLVFKLSSGTLPQNVGAWASMLAKHGSRPSPITPWSYNGRILWNVLRKEGRDPRLTSRTSRSSFWWPRSLSPSRWLGMVFKCVSGTEIVCRELFSFLTHTFSIYINDLD